MIRAVRPSASAAARRRRVRAGTTLLEMLLAVFILGVCLVGFLQGISTGLAAYRLSRFVLQAANVYARGEEAHPFWVADDPEEDLPVTPDSALLKGWNYERTVEEDEDEDGLYVVRARVWQGRGGPGNEREYVRLVYAPNAGSGADADGGRGNAP